MTGMTEKKEKGYFVLLVLRASEKEATKVRLA